MSIKIDTIIDDTRLSDLDLKLAFEYNKTPFPLSMINNLHAVIAGENDEYDWYWIVSLKDGRFSLIKGGCDYTGWECRSEVSCEFAGSLEAAANLAPEIEDRTKRIIRAQLLSQLRNEQPYGLHICKYYEDYRERR